MNSSQAINKIKVLLGMQLNFTDAKLQDGTIVSYDKLEAGGTFEVITTDGTKVPAPVGIHILEDETAVTVEQEGVIATVEVKQIEQSQETPVDESLADTSSVDADPATSTEEPSVKPEEKIIELETRISAIEEVLKEILSGMVEYKEQFNTLDTKVVELSKQPSAEPVFITKVEQIDQPQSRGMNLDLIKKQLQ